MTPAIAKAILVIGAVSWFIIRWPHQRRSWKTKTRLDQRALAGNVEALAVAPVVEQLAVGKQVVLALEGALLAAGALDERGQPFAGLREPEHNM